jgi:hypothetical protein
MQYFDVDEFQLADVCADKHKQKLYRIEKYNGHGTTELGYIVAEFPPTRQDMAIVMRLKVVEV